MIRNFNFKTHTLMNAMTINYLLLAVTGIYSVIIVVNLIRGRGWVSNRMRRDILILLLFVLVLIATIMGMDYYSFQRMIEGRL